MEAKHLEARFAVVSAASVRREGSRVSLLVPRAVGGRVAVGRLQVTCATEVLIRGKMSSQWGWELGAWGR